LIEAGAHVGVLDLPSSPGPEVQERHKGALTFVPGDVTSTDDVTRALDVLSERGNLRVVVNCAGIGPPGKVLGKTGPLPLDDFERIVRINLSGTFNVIRLAAARISKTDSVDGERGVIVNTSSVAAFDGQIGQPAYAAAKGGIVSMALPIARELARHQIRVATIAPGTFDTPLLKTLAEDIRQSLGAQVPHPSRLGDPAEFGALVRHIVENPMLNGEVIRLDGAIRMAAR
jgi:NAD(P)-dependent dehydrogenase (short-subunit alcohol dehydrogenase family)